jgi:acetyl esterase
MPHANMAHWQSVVFGREIEYVAPRSVEDMVRRRAERSPADLGRFAADDTGLAAIHRDVALRDDADVPRADVFVPEGDGPFPVLQYIHGGGWLSGSKMATGRVCSDIARSGVVVVSVDYALAPERPFPAGLRDCVQWVQWIQDNAGDYNGDPTRLAVAGGSAGGNLAAEVALVLHGGVDLGSVCDDAVPDVRLSALLLLWGVLDVAHWVERPGYYAGVAELYVQAYLGASFTDRVRSPLVSPIECDALGCLPPTYLSCGAEDALLDQSLRITSRMAAVDVPVTLSVVPGADHEFLRIPGLVAGSEAELGRILEWLHRSYEPVSANGAARVGSAAGA